MIEEISMRNAQDVKVYSKGVVRCEVCGHEVAGVAPEFETPPSPEAVLMAHSLKYHPNSLRVHR